MKKRKLSDLIIFSDVDGTLLNNPHPTPQRNIEALERFVEKGGRFALATGRSERYIRELVDLLPVNFPCVIFNGGGIYDFEKEEYLYRVMLPEQSKVYIREIMERFPSYGFMIVCEDAYYDILGSTARVFPDIMRHNVTTVSSLDEIDSEYYKCIFFIKQDQQSEFYEYVKARNFPGVRFVRVELESIEMLPEGVSKGSALEWLTDLTGVARENMAAIGDYYNDLEMIEYAGIGATMRSTPEDIKALASLYVRECGEGSVADLVEQLESMFE